MLVPQPTTADAIQNREQPFFASLSARHRIKESGLQFNKLSIGERKKFYHEAAYHVLNCPSRNLIANEAATRVAMMYDIIIADSGCLKIKISFNSRIKGAKVVGNLVEPII